MRKTAMKTGESNEESVHQIHIRRFLFLVSDLRRIRRQCRYMCYSFMALACAGSTLTMMKPFLSARSGDALPYPMWTPLDISTRSFNYWFMYGYEAISIYTMSVVHAGIDCLFYAIFASIHYEVCALGHRLCELGHHQPQVTYDVDKFDEIVELIKIHVQIDRFAGVTRTHATEPLFELMHFHHFCLQKHSRLPSDIQHDPVHPSGSDGCRFIIYID